MLVFWSTWNPQTHAMYSWKQLRIITFFLLGILHTKCCLLCPQLDAVRHKQKAVWGFESIHILWQCRLVLSHYFWVSSYRVVTPWFAGLNLVGVFLSVPKCHSQNTGEVFHSGLWVVTMRRRKRSTLGFKRITKMMAYRVLTLVDLQCLLWVWCDTERAVNSVQPEHFSDDRRVHCAVVLFTVLVTVHSSTPY